MTPERLPIQATPDLIAHVAAHIHHIASAAGRHVFQGSTRDEIAGFLSRAGSQLSLDPSRTDGPSYIHFEVPLGEGHSYNGACLIADDISRRLLEQATPVAPSDLSDSSISSESHDS